MSARHKTLRKSQSDISGEPIDYSVNDSLEQFLMTGANSAYKRPWHRLERGLRLNRLRLFVEEMAGRRGLKQTEQSALLATLTKALDKKILNSKTAVTYDPDTERITEIKPLVMHQNAAGEVLFQLLERRNAVTFRRRSASGTATAMTPGLGLPACKPTGLEHGLTQVIDTRCSGQLKPGVMISSPAFSGPWVSSGFMRLR